MKREFVHNYLMTNGKYFPSSKLGILNDKLEDTNVKEYSVNLSFKNATLFTILYWFLPLFWLIDRFLVRDYLGGFIKLTLPVFAFLLLNFEPSLHQYGVNKDFASAIIFFSWVIWILIDGVTIYNRVKKDNYNRVINLIDRNSLKVNYFPILYLALTLGIGYIISLNEKVNYTERIENINETSIDGSDIQKDETANGKTEINKHKKNTVAKPTSEYDNVNVNPIIPSDEEHRNYEDPSPFEESPFTDSDETEYNDSEISSEEKTESNPFSSPFSGSGTGGNGYGTDDGPGRGDGYGTGGSGGERIRMSNLTSNPKTPNDQHCTIALKLTVDSRGTVVAASVIRANTTTTSQQLIDEVIKLVKKEVRYKEKPGARNETAYYTININPD